MMQRLSIARAMIHDPQVLFLDEPSAGLDPQTRLLLWEIIREYNLGGKTVLLTTHRGRRPVSPFSFVLVAGLVALFSASGGLALGCSVGQAQAGLMFSMVVAPMIFFGCTYYPWSALANFPILQKAVLLNPMVYAGEGLRGTLVPQFPHLSLLAIVAGLAFFNILLLVIGLRQFHRKAID